ncbi:hypothetical protein [Brumimicrobium oceani]|uniref:Uncharacterized protein n=1 Tax=Brumimicrobium oceani TaxID=2100725 RepID=A0A2U2XHM9_9FLAO|nr:hypothetical protein [Brumimicrobium oceani]PWH87221.1 hypothetical protein DIT68_02860 [Brumimicrobium oceani]
MKTLHLLYTFSKLIGIKKPYFYSKNSYYYFESISTKYYNGKYYLRLMEVFKSMKSISSNKKLNYNAHSSTKQIIKEYGTPFYTMKNEGMKETEILYYKKRIGFHKARLEFHFYKERLFFYSYTFPYLSNSDKIEIKKTLEEKYYEKQKIDFTKNYLTDLDKNMISVTDDMEYSILYFCKNDKAISKLESKRKSKQINKLNTNKLHKSDLFRNL